MTRDLRGLAVCIGDAGTAFALAHAPQPVPAGSGDSMSWQTIAGLALAVVATVVLAPKLIKWTS